MKKLSEEELDWMLDVWPSSPREVYDIPELVNEIKILRETVRPLYLYVQTELTMGGPVLDLLKDGLEHFTGGPLSEKAEEGISWLDEHKGVW